MRTIFLLLLMICAAVNAYLKLWGNWWILIGVLIWQIIAIKEIRAYLFNKDIKFIRGQALRKMPVTLQETLLGAFI